MHCMPRSMSDRNTDERWIPRQGRVIKGCTVSSEGRGRMEQSKSQSQQKASHWGREGRVDKTFIKGLEGGPVLRVMST